MSKIKVSKKQLSAIMDRWNNLSESSDFAEAEEIKKEDFGKVASNLIFELYEDMFGEKEDVDSMEVTLDELISDLKCKRSYLGNVAVKLPQCGDEDEHGNCKFHWDANISYVEWQTDDSGKAFVAIY